MPARKRRKIDPDTKPGPARSHVDAHFSALPASPSSLKNGHILNIYVSSESSRTQTERTLQSRYPTVVFSAVLNTRIKSVVSRTLLKFKKLSNPKEFDSFTSICNETFDPGVLTPVVEIVSELVPDHDEKDVEIAIAGEGNSSLALPEGTQQPQPIPSTSEAEVNVSRPEELATELNSSADEATGETERTPVANAFTPTASDASPQPIPSSSQFKTRFSSKKLTPQKARLRDRLVNVSARIPDLHKKYKLRIDELNKKLRTPKRVINQSLKRKTDQLKAKDKEIQDLKAKLAGTELAKELAATKAELEQLRQTHSKHKKYHRTKKKKKPKPGTVPLHQHKKAIRTLEMEKEDLHVQLQEEYCSEDSVISSKKDKKTFNSNYRKCVYNCLLNQVPVEATGHLIQDIVEEMTGKKINSAADPTTVSQCAYELGILTDIQVAETLEKEQNLNIAWDATSLDAEHINEIHINCSGVDGGPPRSLVLQIEILAGGTTADYAQHICQALQDISHSYAEFRQIDKIQFHQTIAQKLKSTLSDRVSVNHCVRVQLEDDLNIELLELKCNVHPLDGLASEARKTMKSLDKDSDFHGTVLGRECATVNIIYGLSKMRYKNGTGDPKGFKHFMKTEKIKSSMVIRYVGNRMHVLFHLAGTFYFLSNKLQQYLEKGCNCQTGFRTALLKDLKSPNVQMQLKALGLVGKLLTGPWMVVLYSNKDAMSNLEAVPMLKTCVARVRQLSENPASVLQSVEDCFGRPLDETDEVLSSLQSAVDETHADQFLDTMAKLLQGCVRVLERQLADYLSGDLSSPTPEMLEVTKSAPVHNIASERILGLTDSQFRRAPNATIGFIDAKVKGKKNKTLVWLKEKSLEEQEKLIAYAITRARKYRVVRKEREEQMTVVYKQRLKVKSQKKDSLFRGRVGRKLQEAMVSMPEDFQAQLSTLLPDADKSQVQVVAQYLQDTKKLEGQYITHVWDMGDEGNVQYCGKIIDIKRPKNKPAKMRVAYWLPDEIEEDSEDSTFKVTEALTDYLLGDLIFSV